MHGAPRTSAAGSDNLARRAIAGIIVGIVVLTLLCPPVLPASVGGTASIVVLYKRSLRRSHGPV